MTFHAVHVPFVVETHHSYAVAAELVRHVSVVGRKRFVWPFDGTPFDNAPWPPAADPVARNPSNG